MKRTHRSNVVTADNGRAPDEYTDAGIRALFLLRADDVECVTLRTVAGRVISESPQLARYTGWEN